MTNLWLACWFGTSQRPGQLLVLDLALELIFIITGLLVIDLRMRTLFKPSSIGTMVLTSRH
jgi:hypothetical protein